MLKDEIKNAGAEVVSKYEEIHGDDSDNGCIIVLYANKDSKGFNLNMSVSGRNELILHAVTEFLADMARDCKEATNIISAGCFAKQVGDRIKQSMMDAALQGDDNE